MTEPSPNASDLAAVFVAAGGPAGSAIDLGERLSALLRDAQAAHPTLQLDGARFIRRLAGLRADDTPLAEWLAAIRAGDLYLACACLEGLPAAAAALDRLLRAEAGAYLATLRPTPDFVDDVAQAVRERVLVGTEGSPPRIAEYSGRGALGAWLRVVTVRLALDVRRKRMEELARDQRGVEQARPEAAYVDPEIEMLKRRHAGAFNAAFRAAIGALTSEQRRLLHMHFVGSATLDQLAATLQVHRATVARRISEARQEILAHVRRQLREELRLKPTELESLMGLMRSQLDLSLSTAFPEAPEAL